MLIKRYIQGEFLWLPWGKFYRREFLRVNDIKFIQSKYSEDMVFCFKCLMLAENYVRIPIITNIHRFIEGSTGRRQTEPLEGIEIWLEVVFKVIESMDNAMRDIKFFADNPKYRHEVLDFVIQKHFDFLKDLFMCFTVQELQTFFYDALNNFKSDEYLDAKNIVAAYLFTHRALRI